MATLIFMTLLALWKRNFLTVLQGLETGPIPEPCDPSPCPHEPRTVSILSSHLPPCFPSGTFSISFCMHLSFQPCVLDAQASHS